MSAAKKRINQFPSIVKENSVQIRQYQEIISELIGIFKEHNFLHEFSSQVPEATVAKLPARLCGRSAEFVEGKPKLSTWHSFANWLEKEAKISESKQRWMPEKREWKRSDISKVDRRKSADKSLPGLFAGATGESSRSSYGTKKCPIHQSTNHSFQECKSFKGMLTSEKEKVVEEHKLCLCCLLPGHRLSKCRSKNRCRVENCDMHHHTLVHEVDLKLIERAKAKRESERVPEVERDPAPVIVESEDSSPRQAVEQLEGYLTLRLDLPHDSDKHCIWLVGFVCASTNFSKKNRFFFVFMIGNGRHQALFVGKLYDGLKIPEKMAGFAQKTRGIRKESFHSIREAFARSAKMPSVDCGMLAQVLH